MNKRDEIARFEDDGFLYRIYLRPDGEVMFTITGEDLRMGLVTKEDLVWDWAVPQVVETSRVVNVQSHSVRVLRRIALHLAQYLSKHSPAYFYYHITDDQRRHRIYQRLLNRHAKAFERYSCTVDEQGQYAMFSLR